MAKQMPRPEDYSPFTKLIGLRIEQAAEGRARATLEAQEKLRNNYGTVHGGAVFSMADIAMGAALYFSLKDDEVCRTVEIKISYMNPAASGTLVCDARVIHRTRHLGATEAEIIAGGRIIARATGTYYISKDRGEDIHGKARSKEGV